MGTNFPKKSANIARMLQDSDGFAPIFNVILVSPGHLR